MSEKQKLKKPLITPNLAKEVLVKMEIRGIVKVENMELYHALLKALKQIVK